MKLQQYKEEKDEIYLHKVSNFDFIFISFLFEYGRILTANESHYRIAGFKKGELHPSVTRLGFFVPEKKSMIVESNSIPSKEELREQIENTGYWKWFNRNKFEYELFQKYSEFIGKTEGMKESKLVKMKNQGNKDFGYDVFSISTCKQSKTSTFIRMKDKSYSTKSLVHYKSEHVPFAFELMYEDFGRKYRFDGDKKKWTRRKRDDDVIVRLYMGYPGTEYFYLRKLLRHRIGPLSIEDLLVHPDNEEITFNSYKHACVKLQLVDSSKEYYLCMSDAQDMGFTRGKILGLFAQMIMVGDMCNIGEIWNGVEVTEETELDEIEEKYPHGYKHLMMHFPPKLLKRIFRKYPKFSYDYTMLPLEWQRQAEQYTLRKLNGILQRSGKDYPKELPPLKEISAQEQSIEFLSAHNYEVDVAQKVYTDHRSSMEGNNSIGEPNNEQLSILNDLEKEIEKYSKNPDSYRGYCIMLDAPGGTGKTYLIETIAAYCAINQHLCLCSAFSVTRSFNLYVLNCQLRVLQHNYSQMELQSTDDLV